jgi:hypothetical protein
MVNLPHLSMISDPCKAQWVRHYAVKSGRNGEMDAFAQATVVSMRLSQNHVGSANMYTTRCKENGAKTPLILQHLLIYMIQHVTLYYARQSLEDADVALMTDDSSQLDLFSSIIIFHKASFDEYLLPN